MIETISNFKRLIKAEKAIDFHDIDADKLALWSVSIPNDPANDDVSLSVDTIQSKIKPRVTTTLSKVFSKGML